MTPLYARRAFANTRSGQFYVQFMSIHLFVKNENFNICMLISFDKGDLKAALNDAEKGVVLDSSNPVSPFDLI